MTLPVGLAACWDSSSLPMLSRAIRLSSFVRLEAVCLIPEPCVPVVLLLFRLKECGLARLRNATADPSTHHPKLHPKEQRPLFGDPGTEVRLGHVRSG